MQKKFYFFTALFLLIIFFCQAYFFYPKFFVLDDPYIVLHSAQVMHLGYDPNYLGSPALAGNSSPGHLLFTYLLLFIFPPIYALIMSNWLAILMYSFGIIYLSFCYRCTSWQTFVALICALAPGKTLFQLVNGLETSLAFAAIVWTLILCVLPLTRVRQILLAVLLACLPFIRPELIIFSVLIYLFQLYRYQKNNLLHLKNIMQDVAWVMLAGLPWLLWFWYQLHQVYPSSVSAKNAFFTYDYHSIAQRFYLFAALKNFLIEISMGYILGLILLGATRLGRILLLFIFLFLIAYTLASPAILNDTSYRYLYLFIPIFMFGFISSLHHPSKVIRYSANIGLNFLLIITLVLLPLRFLQYKEYTLYSSNLMREYTNWCMQHIPKDDMVAIQDAGYIAYATSLHLTDFVGLKSPENIFFHKKYTAASHGHLRALAVAQILKKNHAHYLIMTSEWVTIFDLPKQLIALGYQVKLVKKFTLADHPNWNTYEVYLVTEPAH